ncbi:HigA family addiction module antitoxin [Hydrogenovibrio marinus]|uniref:Pirin n=1 Tax=Hydrogenovibrio marinus TaxID=28885 RepID=A0A067A2C4_HYDMR|nr:HigA family addiction module antitoxin [Hydrogenovibrio marinus]KDN96525.1 pirin [Hydrogenovibrio marinus]BBN60271.1 transcriptional regulator [Hydrogenovibrio marinus]
MNRIDNIHPGEILLEEFLEPLQISQNKLAKVMKVPPRRINEIVHGKRSITADTAIRLGLALGTTAQFWTNLQAAYELEEASLAKGAEFVAIERIVA